MKKDRGERQSVADYRSSNGAYGGGSAKHGSFSVVYRNDPADPAPDFDAVLARRSACNIDFHTA